MSAAVETGPVFLVERADPSALGADATTTDEAALVFDAVDRRLSAAGLAITDIVKLRLLYAECADFPAMNAVRDPLFRVCFVEGDFPASTGVVTGGRGARRPRLELEVIACPGKRAVTAPDVITTWSGVTPPFRHANVAGGAVFVAGQGAFAASGALTSTAPLAQARDTLAILRRVLAAAGAPARGVVSIVAYLRPAAMGDLPAITQLIDDFAVDHGPDGRAMATIVPVVDLAFPGMLVEIEIYAAADDRAAARIADAGSAHAATCGSLLLATAQGDALDPLIADLHAALARIGRDTADIDLVTIWFDDTVARGDVEAWATLRLGDATQVSIVPKPAAPGLPVFLFEAFGRGEATGGAH